MATKWGVIGCGAIANDFLMALQTLDDYAAEHQLVACAARDVGRAQEFAAKFGISRSYGSYEELAKDPEIGQYIFRFTEQNVASVYDMLCSMLNF